MQLDDLRQGLRVLAKLADKLLLLLLGTRRRTQLLNGKRGPEQSLSRLIRWRLLVASVLLPQLDGLRVALVVVRDQRGVIQRIMPMRRRLKPSLSRQRFVCDHGLVKVKEALMIHRRAKQRVVEQAALRIVAHDALIQGRRCAVAF